MSLEVQDEFVVFPSGVGSSVTTLDIGYPGSHDPRYLSESGRQHRPTEPEHETLRCSETDDSSGAPGPGREGRSSVVSAPASIGGPPGVRVDGPGNLVDFVPRVNSESSSSEATILEAIPVLENGGMFGRSSETQQPARRFNIST